MAQLNERKFIKKESLKPVWVFRDSDDTFKIADKHNHLIKSDSGEILKFETEDEAQEYVSTLDEAAKNGSVEDYLKKMQKGDPEKVYRKAKGNPNAEKAYRKMKGLDEKLVEPTPEDLQRFEDKFQELGLEIEGKGKTLMGNTHYQLRKELDHDVTRNDVSEIFAELCNLHSRELPTTCNVGVHRDGNNIISASFDVPEKWIANKAVNEKLIEVPQEDKDFFEQAIGDLGFELEAQGKTLMGRDHYQFVKHLDHEVTREDVRPIVHELRLLDGEMENRNIPFTYSMGIHKDDPTAISLALDMDKKWVEDSVEECSKVGDNVLTEENTMSAEDRLKVFADYFDVEVEDLTYNEDDHTIESPVGDFYFGTYDEMEARAIENESEMIDDMGLHLFTPKFQDHIIGDSDLFNAHWFKEYWDEYNDMSDEADQITVESDEDAVQLYADSFGDEALANVIDSEDLLNKEAIAKEVIAWDGLAGILASYDGNEEDLGHGLYAYRWN